MKQKIDVISARIAHAPSSPKSGIVTILLQQRSILPCTIFDSTAEERKMMTDDGPQPLIRQLAITVHHRPETSVVWPTVVRAAKVGEVVLCMLSDA